MTELSVKLSWRWITEERKFFQLYRGWRCRVWEMEPGGLWEYRAEYNHDGVFRGCYGVVASQQQAERSTFDAVDMLMGSNISKRTAVPEYRILRDGEPIWLFDEVLIVKEVGLNEWRRIFITDIPERAVAEPHSVYRRPLHPDENEVERLAREFYVRQYGGALSARDAFCMAMEFLTERDRQRREASDAKPQG